MLNDANVIKNRFDEDNCKKVTYSFRATFITSFTEQKLNKSLLQQIVGHLDQDKERMTNHYTKKFARGVIYKELREYKMPDIDYLLQLKHKANKTA
ncbi:hypothetical protein [Pseudoalteromonas aurantia]|uniref:Integrase n=1 Tax=Pseudoalteromonas aurantia TaxID=43654 RepID=A0ABY2VSA0_9GAMM|nr:hypothetical protein [Pseudoalteromonas aurantia]TMO69763.1 hypothetical protein CWC20_20355 [Pseudoalteromonas aurantia]